jgi:hypothetical protein
LGIWSFVVRNRNRTTLLIFDHLDAYDSREDRDSITFYWRGLIDNLTAFCEGREIPFDHDTGDYRRRTRRRAQAA